MFGLLHLSENVKVQDHVSLNHPQSLSNLLADLFSMVLVDLGSISNQQTEIKSMCLLCFISYLLLNFMY